MYLVADGTPVFCTIESIQAALPGFAADKKLSAENLILAIRDADSLNDLTHLVGPDQDEVDAAAVRGQRIEKLYADNSDCPADWPADITAELNTLLAEQDVFEARYC